MIARVLSVCAFTACFAVNAIGASTTSLKPIDPVAIQSAVEAVAREFLVPGALVALHTPKDEFVFGYGTTELGAANQPRANTHFRAASNSKTMTAAVILQLAQEQRLRLDDPISRYVQDVPNGDHITIDQLLRMRSGLYNYTNAPELAESLDKNPTKDLDFGRTSNNRVEASTHIRSGCGIRLLQYKLSPARSRRGEDRRPTAGQQLSNAVCSGQLA